MNQEFEEIGRTLVSICHRVEAKGFVSATDGNISARLPNGDILATPTTLNKGLVTLSDLVVVSLEGKQVAGNRSPSSEMDMHLFIYRNRKDVLAVVHCHPPYATGFAAARISMRQPVFPEVIIGFGEIPLAEYATPSTKEVGESLKPFIAKSNAILLANHGVVTYGTDLWDAYFKMEKIEHTAHSLFVAKMLGGERMLNNVQVEKLKKAAAAAKGK